ncbi:MAG TPA: bile acid:sodium symporter family protein [Egicoccus sp.]|nr:bile acid:sodium symporter family protein [Egicoccus sp.]HSK22517.1 bile acid:sodium symporter family protein [Egicoccus sp.]
MSAPLTLAVGQVGGLLAQAGVDEVRLNFDPASLMVLNVAIGLIMFGIALDVRVHDLKAVFASPRAPLVGLLAQFLLLPAATYALTRVLDPAPSIALGMILVGSCPGGNVSNIVTHLAKGNTGLSIGMTGVATLVAAVATPANFAFWGSLDPGTREVLRSVSLDPADLAVTIGLLLALPVAAGVLLRLRRPALAEKLYRPMRIVSIVFFAAFVAIAFLSNLEHFTALLEVVAWAVFLHNAVALALGYGAAAAVRLPERDRRAVSIEIGIQNSALALVLIFGFFDGLGGMALVAAWWGIWHLIAGLGLAAIWSRHPPRDVAPPVPVAGT